MNGNLVFYDTSLHTYRTNFNDWYIDPDCDIEISNDGLTAIIKKFNPISWCMRSNESTKTNTFIGEKYSHWKLKISNLESIYNQSNNIDLLPFRATGDGNSIYKVHGVMVCPLMANEEYFYRFPWDMGIPGGSWKDWNGGWQVCGYIYNGIKDRSPFNKFSDGWGANSNCQIGIGIYKNIKPDSSKYIIADPLPTNGDSVDVTKQYIKYTRWKGNAIYVPTINDDNTVTWTEQGQYKEIVDISDNPIIVTIIPQDSNGVTLHKNNIWKGYVENHNVRRSFKTVKNCLAKYYQGIENDDKIVIPYILPEGRDTNDTIYYSIPTAREISDIYNYNPHTLRLEIPSKNSKTYVNWFNRYTAENIQDFYKIEKGTQKRLYLGGFYINNDIDNPIKLYYTSSKYQESQRYYTLDGLCNNGGTSTNATGVCRINNLQIIFKATANNTFKFSTAYRSFQGFKGDIDIVHLDENNNFVYPGETCKFGFIPIQLNSTFANSNISKIKREWICWRELTNMCYAFEMMPNLTELQSYDGDEIKFFPHNAGQSGQSANVLYGWPYFYEYTKNNDGTVIKSQKSVNEGYSIIQAFDRCPKLTRIEPILNVKYFPNESYVYWAFGTETTAITHLRIKGINNFNWDFANTTNFGLPNLDAESIKYIFDNAEDLVSKRYNENNIDTNNVSSKYPGIYFDPINVRSSESYNGLSINCPSEWKDKITNEMVTNMNAKGWTVKINGEIYT